MNRILVVALLLGARIWAADEPAAGPRINLGCPADFDLVQRSTPTGGEIYLSGSIIGVTNSAELPTAVQARVTGTSAFGVLSDNWRPVHYYWRQMGFFAILRLPAGGWYRLEVRVLHEDVLMASVVVEHIGVGEIFVIAGQSNSANYGEELQKTKTGLVVAFDGTTWRPAYDPEPGADGKKGSFMPPFGDEMAERFHVPIGLVPTGIGATSVREWLPRGTRLTRPPTLIRYVFTAADGTWESTGKIFNNFTARIKLLGTNGFRAVLWHQGESDAHQADPERTLPGADYRKYLEQIIRESRAVIGWEAPWFVAQVSYHRPGDEASPDIRAAQKAVWDDGLALPGPDTDTLTGEMREKNGTGIHLSAKGLKAHAHMWVEKVSPWLEQQLGEPDKGRPR